MNITQKHIRSLTIYARRDYSLQLPASDQKHCENERRQSTLKKHSYFLGFMTQLAVLSHLIKR